MKTMLLFARCGLPATVTVQAEPASKMKIARALADSTPGVAPAMPVAKEISVQPRADQQTHC